MGMPSEASVLDKIVKSVEANKATWYKHKPAKLWMECKCDVCRTFAYHVDVWAQIVGARYVFSNGELRLRQA